MPETILILDPITDDMLARLSARVPEGFVLTRATARGDTHLAEVIADADYAITGQVGVSGDVLRAAKRLRLLHKWGVGIDNLDVATAHARGIAVARTTGSNSVAVAEFTIGLAIASLRSLAYGHERLTDGVWVGMGLKWPSFLLSGKTVGIVGMGMIGQAVARLLQGFGCPILYSKRTRLPEAQEAALNASHTPLAELLRRSDVVALNCPLTPETAGIINRDSLRTMKPTAVLVNTARGGIVVEHDLVEALRARVIHGAAMDVFETEPLPPDSELRGVDNLIITPHLAAMAADLFDKTVAHMFDNIARVSRGEPVPEIDAVRPA